MENISRNVNRSCGENAMLVTIAMRRITTFRSTIDRIYDCGEVKVNCTVVQALRLCTGCTVHRGSRGIGKVKVHRCTGTEALYRLYGL